MRTVIKPTSYFGKIECNNSRKTRSMVSNIGEQELLIIVINNDK